ncbi:hypothetical protein [Chitinophaga sp. YIM B06452]|uniref:hypothetical protein n=1 Tax=Chitinophaga sp. YIM B06452 TaxID=3082158 RepID=UPI0031FF1B60
MKTSITALVTLLLLTTGSNAHPPSPHRSDSLFKKAIERFREKITGTDTGYAFSSPRDSVAFVNYFTGLLDRELKTKFQRQHPAYADRSFETPGFRLAIQQLVFRQTIPPLASQVIRPVTKAPLEFKFLHVKNRLIIFSYTPFQKSEARDKAIADFEKIYLELLDEVNND